jgi:hypothetical protein
MKVVILMWLMFLGSSADAAVFWSTHVHNLMIRQAFSDEDEKCLAEMMKGSREADRHQDPADSFIHAMRAPGQSIESARARMWDWIDSGYRTARFNNSRERACYFRGMALHPIMDSTSPVHRDFQEWDTGIAGVPAMLKHGSLEEIAGEAAQAISRRFGVSAGSAVERPLRKIAEVIARLGDVRSEEDMLALSNNAELLNATADLMRIVDVVYMLK